MPQTTTAALIMNVEPITLSPTDDVLDAARRLLAGGLEGAPVLDPGGFIIGVLTLADVLYSEKLVHTPQPFLLFDALLYFGAGRTLAREFEKMTALTVQGAMSSPAITVTADTPIAEIASLMIDKGLTVVPVCDDDNTLLGIISRHDVVRFTLDRIGN